MTLDPLNVDIVAVELIQHLIPQVGIQGAFFPISHPVVGSPLSGPAFVNCVHNVFGITVQRNLSPVFQRFEALDYRQHFHAIVGRAAESCAEFIVSFALNHDSAVASRPRISNG